MAKANQKIIVINFKGAESALEAVSGMVESVVEALENQFPRLTIQVKELEDVSKPFIMVPTKIIKKAQNEEATD